MRGQSRFHWPHSVAKALHVIYCFPLLFGVFVSACHAAGESGDAVLVEVRHVGFDHLSRTPVIILQDKDRTKAMPIWVGVAEARAIELELRGDPPPRPLTHDLLKNILDQVGVLFEKVVVSELKGSTYYARIHLVMADKPLEVDSRPSDAIALALRFHRPIFVAKSLFESALSTDLREARTEPTSTKIAGVTVQDLTAELAAYFNLPDTNGVLVADSGVETGEDSLQRGDVIVTIEGEVIHGVTDFRNKVRQGKGRVLTAQVQRNGKAVGVRFTSTEE